jgi:hypothetical protein
MAIVKVTPEMTAKAIGETDWRAVDAQTDADIARNVAADPDAAPIIVWHLAPRCLTSAWKAEG